MHSRRRVARIKAIHAAARATGITNDNRRALQKQITGKSSCREMTLTELGQVLDRLNHKRPRLAAVHSDADAKAKFHTKISSQLTTLNLPDAYAEGIARRMHKRTLSDCTAKQLGSVIAALWYHERRQSSP